MMVGLVAGIVDDDGHADGGDGGDDVDGVVDVGDDEFLFHLLGDIPNFAMQCGICLDNVYYLSILSQCGLCGSMWTA
jgi:hypothetical protein